MPLYRYEAVDRSGKVVRGAMNAANEQMISQKLSVMGYSLKAAMLANANTKQRAAASQQNARSKRTSSPSALGHPVTVTSSVSISALTRFYRQLATLVQSGMPLFQSLSEVQRTTVNRKLRNICDSLSTRVQSGSSLSSAMANYPGIFPAYTVGMIWAGEVGGYLDVALDEAATELESEYRYGFLARIGWFIVRFNTLLFFLFAPLLGAEKHLLQFVNASIGDSESASRAPDLFAAYLHGILTISVPLILGWIVLNCAVRRIKRVPAVRAALDSFILIVPVWGPLQRTHSVERFMRTLHGQYQSAVPLSQSWLVAASTVRNSTIAARLRVLGDIFHQPNYSLQAAFAKSDVFSPEDIGMIATAEKAGSIPEMLERLTNYHNDQLGRRKTTSRVVSVVLFNLALIIPSGIVLIMIALITRRFYSQFLSIFG